MREIEFRGKRVNIDEWVYGYYDGCYEGATINYLSNGYARNACVIPETVGQYTGLNDKKGRKIFEGDIVRVFDNFICTVEEHNGAYGYKGSLGFASFCDNIYLTWINGKSNNIEVIGNIHDSPELLTAEQTEGQGVQNECQLQYPPQYKNNRY